MKTAGYSLHPRPSPATSNPVRFRAWNRKRRLQIPSRLQRRIRWCSEIKIPEVLEIRRGKVKYSAMEIARRMKISIRERVRITLSATNVIAGFA